MHSDTLSVVSSQFRSIERKKKKSTHPPHYSAIMLSCLDLVSVLQDQDVVSVAKQQCGISKTLRTPSLPGAQKRTPFQSLDGTLTGLVGGGGARSPNQSKIKLAFPEQ